MHKILEHASDILIEVKNKTYSKALEELCNAIIQFIGKGKGKEEINTKVKKENKKYLEVVNILNEIIYLCETTPFSPNKIKIIEKEKYIEVKLIGSKKFPKNIIKAVTFHNIKIKKIDSQFYIQVLLDV